MIFLSFASRRLDFNHCYQLNARKNINVFFFITIENLQKDNLHGI